MPDLTPDQYKDLLRKLDAVCQQAQDLSKQIRQSMADRARQDQQLISRGKPERRRVPRKFR